MNDGFCRFGIKLLLLIGVNHETIGWNNKNADDTNLSSNVNTDCDKVTTHSVKGYQSDTRHPR